MRRNERERIARRDALKGVTVGYWKPKDFTLDEYYDFVNSHPPIPEMLDYLESHPRDWTVLGEEFDFAESQGGVCEKCSTRKLNADPSLELKLTTSALGGVDVRFSKLIADQLIKGKQPITLTPN